MNSAWSGEIVGSALLALDFCAVILAGLLSDAIAPGSGRLTSHVAGSMIAALGVVQANAHFKLYDLSLATRPLPMTDRVITAHSVAFGTLAAVAYLAGMPLSYPSDWKLGLFILSLLLLLTGRLLFSQLIVQLGRGRLLSRNVVIVGAGEQAERLVDQLERGGCPWTRIVGIFDDRARSGDRRVPKRLKQRYSVLGTTRDLVSFARRIRVDDVFLALPWTSEARLQQVLHTIEVVPANLHLWPDVASHSLIIRHMAALDGMPVLTLASKPVDGWGNLSKWVLDKLLAAIGLLLLSPLLLLVSIAIKCESRGPVLFRQSRLGFNNKLINVYKFRSMHHGDRDVSAERLATRGDPRITRVGRVLRRLSIDELPQLLNVLVGDMSLVGPRPHALKAKAGGHLYHEVVAEYALRHRMKPGITGWAQVSGWRGETDTEEKIVRRVEHDLYYINNWSILFDLYILVMTVLKAPFQGNAY